MMLEEINKRLANTYGRNLMGQPFFRIITSNDAYETRVGTFNEFYGSIFIRSFIGAKKVLKYNYIRDRYILEMWKYEHMQPTKELPNPDGYEIIYLFEDKFGRPLPLEWKVIQIICFNILNPQLDPTQIKNAIEAAEFKIEKDDIAYFETLFGENSSYELSKRHEGSRISNIGVKDVN